MTDLQLVELVLEHPESVDESTRLAALCLPAAGQRRLYRPTEPFVGEAVVQRILNQQQLSSKRIALAGHVGGEPAAKRLVELDLDGRCGDSIEVAWALCNIGGMVSTAHLIQLICKETDKERASMLSSILYELASHHDDTVKAAGRMPHSPTAGLVWKGVCSAAVLCEWVKIIQPLVELEKSQHPCLNERQIRNLIGDILTSMEPFFNQGLQTHTNS